MFRCQMCNSISAPGARAFRAVIEQRPAEYPSRAKAQRHRGGRKGKYADDPGGAGYEISKELQVCRPCAEAHEAKLKAQEAASEAAAAG